MSKPFLPRLLATAGERMNEVVFSLPLSVLTAEPDLCRRLISAAPDHASVVVATEEDAAERLCALAAPIRDIFVVTGPAGRPRSIWAQDALIVFESGTERARVACSARPEAASPARTLFEELAASGRVERIFPQGLPLRGGNLLIGDDFVLIGADEWRRLALTAARQDMAAEDWFRAHVDGSRRIIVVGGAAPARAGGARIIIGPDGENWRENSNPGIIERDSTQALYHLDLFITLAGRDQGSGKSRLIVADLGLGPRPSEEREYEDLAARLDGAARSLEAEGFCIVRCPIALLSRDDPVNRRRLWYFASWNNAWVETYGAGGTVYLPQFGGEGREALTQADDDVRKLWQALGFKVRAIGDGDRLAQLAGGLNCVSKILKRGAAPD